MLGVSWGTVLQTLTTSLFFGAAVWRRKAHTCFQCHRIHLGEVIQLMEWGLPTQELLEISLEGCPTLGIRA